jgi:hypothetical protein
MTRDLRFSETKNLSELFVRIYAVSKYVVWAVYNGKRGDTKPARTEYRIRDADLFGSSKLRGKINDSTRAARILWIASGSRWMTWGALDTDGDVFYWERRLSNG